MNDTIHRKIQAYFNGQLSAVEEAELVEWLKLKSENRAYYQQVKENLLPNNMEHPLLFSSYSDLKSKILINQQFNSVVSGPFKNLRFTFLRIAALFLVALVTGFTLAYLLIDSKKPAIEEVVWFKTHVPRGEKSQLLLPDGSRVWINSESDLSYPSNFMGGNRVIKLKGEAYFEVAKQEGKPFTVNTSDYDIRVLGTKFNVMAYADFGRTETSLIEGNVEIQRGGEVIPIKPGQEIIFKDQLFAIEASNTDLATKWKDDIFDFDKIPLKELVVRLERWYDVKIKINNPELNNISYSGIFKNEETIWQVLNTFQLTLPIRYSRVGFREFEIKMN